mmetsp:Transcript_9751/g.26599  ORF Transcript_9751/g.26599 Transcript_9751/m.26599 type:complete len:268 (+) Transcript_9751:163-966(+)
MAGDRLHLDVNLAEGVGPPASAPREAPQLLHAFLPPPPILFLDLFQVGLNAGVLVARRGGWLPRRLDGWQRRGRLRGQHRAGLLRGSGGPEPADGGRHRRGLRQVCLPARLEGLLLRHGVFAGRVRLPPGWGPRHEAGGQRLGRPHLLLIEDTGHYALQHPPAHVPEHIPRLPLRLHHGQLRQSRGRAAIVRLQKALRSDLQAAPMLAGGPGQGAARAQRGGRPHDHRVGIAVLRDAQAGRHALAVAERALRPLRPRRCGGRELLRG